MKYYIAFSFLIAFINNIQAKDPGVNQKVFQEFRTEIKDSLHQIGNRIDNGNETLKISREYSEKADKLSDSFITMLEVIYGVAGFLLSAVVAILYSLLKSKFQNSLANKINEYENEMERVAKTEKETIFLKENSGILILHKSTHEKEDAAFRTLEKSIRHNYKHAVHHSLENLNNFEFELFYHKGIDENCPIKVIVLDDELFNEFKVEDKVDINNSVLKSFFDKLEIHRIGLVLFGQTQLREAKLSYLSFANQPYSVYANLNHLLKYIRVAEEIRIV
ncbi:MAG: hypothetical protein WAT21_06330 [Saprospiraceae bacterium]